MAFWSLQIGYVVTITFGILFGATDNIFAKYDSTKRQPEVVSFHEEQTTHELPNRIFTLAGVINS